MTRHTLAPPNGAPQRWEDFFGPGERLLWEGAPAPGLHFHPMMLFLSLVGMPFLAIGFLTLYQGVGALGGGLSSLSFFAAFFMIPFAAVFIAVGVGLVAGPWFLGPISVGRMRYALSTERAYIVKHFWSRKLESHAIKPGASIEISYNGKIASVRFATETDVDTDGDRTTKKIGFENIEDGERVYGLLRKVAEGRSSCA